VQLYRYFVSQFSDFCRHNPSCCFSTSVYCCNRIFHYRLSPETFWYTLIFRSKTCFQISSQDLRCDAEWCCGGIPTFQTQDGGSMDLWNVGILPQHYNGVTTQRTSTWIFTTVKTSNLAFQFLSCLLWQWILSPEVDFLIESINLIGTCGWCVYYCLFQSSFFGLIHSSHFSWTISTFRFHVQ